MLASLQEGVDWIIHDYIETHPGDVGDTSGLINFVLSKLPALNSHPADATQEASPLITALAELPQDLPRREALPEPQNGNDCSAQASRSATDAIRQISQQASESVRQANQSASQGIQQANQSASQGIQQASQSAANAIRQVENGASQTVAQFSRSSSSISSSASSAVLSIQSSADQAVSRASNSAKTAMANASQAILQASAAIAAATGSAAAAGSSFLEQAAKATQGQVTASSLADQKATTNREILASQTVAITATQAAIAIVGSIIASTLITFLIYYLFQRHRQRLLKTRQQNDSWDFEGPMIQRKLSASTTQSSAPSQIIINKETRVDVERTEELSNSQISLSMFPKTPTSTGGGGGRFPTPSPIVKRTYVPWNPSEPPPPPKLGSIWLSSPTATGKIKLPLDNANALPLGGQLNSPLSKNTKADAHKKAWDLPLRAFPEPSPNEREMAIKINSPPKQQSARSRERQRQREMLREIPAYLPSPLKRQYSEAKKKVWVDDDGVSEAGSSSGSVKSKGGGLGRKEVLRMDKEMAGIRKSEVWSEALGGRTPDTAGSVRVYDAVRGVVIAPRGVRRGA